MKEAVHATTDNDNQLVEKERNLQRVLYRKDPDQSSEVLGVTKALILGVKSENDLSEASITQMAKFVKLNSSKLDELDEIDDSEVLVDDLKQLFKEVDEMSAKVGLECKGWSSSCEDPLPDLAEEDAPEISISRLYFSQILRGRQLDESQVFEGDAIVSKELVRKIIFNEKQSSFDLPDKFTPTIADLEVDLREALEKNVGWKEEKLKGMKFQRACMLGLEGAISKKKVEKAYYVLNKLWNITMIPKLMKVLKWFDENAVLRIEEVNDKKAVRNDKYDKKAVKNAKNDKKVVKTYTVKGNELMNCIKAVDDHDCVQHEVKVKMAEMEIIKICNYWCCLVQCVFTKHGEIAQLDATVVLFKENLFPAMLDRSCLEFEEFMVELSGDDLEHCIVLSTLAVLGLHEIDKLVLTHYAVNTVLLALTVLGLHESDVEEDQYSASVDTSHSAVHILSDLILGIDFSL
jgi:hypothetical protein